MDCSLFGSSVHGLLQARMLEWIAVPFSRGSSWLRDWTWVSCIAGRFFTIWASRFLWISTVKKPRKLKQVIEILVMNVADNSHRGKSEWPRSRWRDTETTWKQDLRKRKMIPADSEDRGNRTLWGDPVVVTSVWQLSGKCGYKCPMIQKALNSCSSLMTLPFMRPEIGCLLIMVVVAWTNKIHEDTEWTTWQSQEQWSEYTGAKDRQYLMCFAYMDWVLSSRSMIFIITVPFRDGEIGVWEFKCHLTHWGKSCSAWRSGFSPAVVLITVHHSCLILLQKREQRNELHSVHPQTIASSQPTTSLLTSVASPLSCFILFLKQITSFHL